MTVLLLPLIGMRRTFLQGNFSNYGGMLIGKGKLEMSIDMNIIGTAVTPYHEIKYLGINIDRSLSFTSYISEICKKTSRRVEVVMRLWKLIPTNAKLALYKAAILPHMTYCSTVWHFCKCTDALNLGAFKNALWEPSIVIGKHHVNSYYCYSSFCK